MCKECSKKKFSNSAKINFCLKECCIVMVVGMSYYQPQQFLPCGHDSSVFLVRWFPFSMIESLFPLKNGEIKMSVLYVSPAIFIHPWFTVSRLQN